MARSIYQTAAIFGEDQETYRLPLGTVHGSELAQCYRLFGPLPSQEKK